MSTYLSGEPWRHGDQLAKKRWDERRRLRGVFGPVSALIYMLWALDVRCIIPNIALPSLFVLFLRMRMHPIVQQQHYQVHQHDPPIRSGPRACGISGRSRRGHLLLGISSCKLRVRCVAPCRRRASQPGCALDT